jgi:hypothetical protein
VAEVLNRGQKAAITKDLKKKAESIRNLFEKTASGKRNEWQIREQKSYDFFLNSQLTDTELEQLKAAGMPDFIINRITPIIETMKYFITAQNPRWRAVGADGSDSAIAKIHTDMIDYSWYISGGKSVFAQVAQDCLVKSKGYLHIILDPDADRGLGEVKFERVDPFHVFTSQRANDPYERDATFQIIKKDIPKEELLQMLPEYEKQIKRASGYEESLTYSSRSSAYSKRPLGDEMSDSIQPGEMETPYKASTGEIDEVVQYYEMYEPIRIRFYNLFVQEAPPESEMQEVLKAVDQQVNDFASELEVQYLEKQEQLRGQLENGELIRERYDLELGKTKGMMQEAIKEKQAVLRNQAKEAASKIVQQVVSEDEYEAISKSSIADTIVEAIPFWEKKVRHSCSVGDQFLWERILNCAHSPLVAIPYLHTGTTLPMSAVTPLIGKQREINKAHQIMIHHANLASNLRWKYVEGEIDVHRWEQYSASSGALLPYRPGFSQDGPKEIMPQPINNAFFTIEQDSKSDMEYVAGIQPPSMGIGSSNDETYRGFLAKDEYGTRRVRSWVTNVLEPALEHSGKIYTELAKDTYTIHKVFRIVQPNPAGGETERESQINVPLYDDYGAIIGKWNDYATSRYDLRMVAGSTLPLNRWAMAEEYKQWLELGIIDDIAFMQLTDIPDKEAIIERKSRLAETQRQLQQLEEVLEDREGTIETLERQLVQLGIKDAVMNAKMEIIKSKTETQMQQKLGQERIKDDVKSTRQRQKEEVAKVKSAGQNVRKPARSS